MVESPHLKEDEQVQLSQVIHQAIHPGAIYHNI